MKCSTSRKPEIVAGLVAAQSTPSGSGEYRRLILVRHPRQHGRPPQSPTRHQSGSAGVHLPGCPIHTAWGRAPIAGWTLLYATNCSMLDVVVIRDYRRNANTCHQSRACVVCIDVGHLLSSIEAEHDSKPRHSGPALADAAKTLDRLVGPPDVLAFGGWWGTDPGYLGLDRTAIETSAMVVDGGRMRDSASHRDAPVNRT